MGYSAEILSIRSARSFAPFAERQDSAVTSRRRDALQPPPTDMDPYRRNNYDSGSDYVLEYGELRFTFNERDFCERVEQAGMKLGFIERRLAFEESEDLVNLVVNGEVNDAVSALGHHINECWCELSGNDEGSLVHWLRRLVFRGAWLDQRVIEGELDVIYDEDTTEFLYAQPERGYEPIILATGPSWRQVAYHQ